MNKDHLLKIAPRAAAHLGAINAAMDRFGIVTPGCQAAFIA
jgi:predicted chitinase